MALPPKAKLHNVFHVLVLKKWLGTGCPVQDTLPTIVEDVELTTPQAILDHCTTQGHEEILVHWQGRSPADATWEIKAELLLRFPSLGLEDKAKIKGVEVLRGSSRLLDEFNANLGPKKDSCASCEDL